MKKSIVIILTVMLLVIPVFAMGAKNLPQYSNMVNLGQIEVNGYAKITKKADQLDLNINISDVQKTSLEAQRSVNRSSNLLVARLVNLGLKEDSIITQNISLGEYREWEKDEYVVKGQKASQRLIIKLDYDRELVANIMDIIASDMNIRVGYINYSLKEDYDLQRQVRRMAIKNAYDKAEDYALASGNQVFEVVLISENLGNTYYPETRYAMAEAKGYDESNSSTNIYPTDIIISQTVKVVYSIKPM